MASDPPKIMRHSSGLGKSSSSLPPMPPFLAASSLPFPSFGLPQKALEELVVLVDVLDGVGMVGAWTLHELVEVVGLALLGLLSRAIGHGDQS